MIFLQKHLRLLQHSPERLEVLLLQVVGLGNVTNESKATMFTSPAFTGTPTGITAAMVGLGNVTNESKATMFTSPTFTGTPVLLTATATSLLATGSIGYTTGSGGTVTQATSKSTSALHLIK
jgi:hypothetical protein